MKILVIYYSTYGHVHKMAQAVAEGAGQVAGAEVFLRRVPETLPREVLEKNQTIQVKVARIDPEQQRLSLEMIPEGQGSEETDYYKKHIAASSKQSSGSLGTLGDILRAKMDKKN